MSYLGLNRFYTTPFLGCVGIKYTSLSSNSNIEEKWTVIHTCILIAKKYPEGINTNLYRIF
jgi:hypothetical protein